MTQTKEGSIKALATLKAKFPSEEAYLNWRAEMGARGGSVLGVKKGFALLSPERRREVGRIGGLISKRKPNPDRKAKENV